MKDLIDKDIYWGEFEESHMDHILSLCEEGEYGSAKKYIDTELRRTDFIFGSARSDFLYMADIDKNSVCLDIGCGLGVHTFNMAKIAGEVHSCDLSKKRVKFCEHRKNFDNVSNVELYHSDINNLPFKENTFDFIAMNGVVEWLGEQNLNKDPRQDQVDGLKKVRAMLKEGGTLYIGIENRFALTYLNNGRDHNRLKYTTFMPRFFADFWTKRKIGKSYRTYTYSKFGYEKLLSDSGFSREDIAFYIAHPGYNLPKYLVEFTDFSGLRFFVDMIISNSKLKFLKSLVSNRFALRFVRHLFYSYAIFVKK